MFRNEIKKILLEAGDSLPEEFVSTWTHFEDMVFLKDQIVTKKTLRNLNITGVDLNDSDDEELVEIPVSPVNFEEDDEEVNGGEPLDGLASMEVPQNLSEIIPSEYQKLDHFLKPSVPPRKRKREPEYMNGYYQQSLQVDDDYHFLVSFLPSMKQMPLQTKMWFRLKMQELLYSCTVSEVTSVYGLGAAIDMTESKPPCNPE
ncbi:hypothetical protein J6590_043757 [Homalodisca vitripennis]|nr:hypothetical protein J6590_043757 [Homalodisca vitripennis]